MKPNFSVGDLLPIGMTIVVLAVGLAFGLNILADIKDDTICADSGYEWNATSGVCNAVDNSSELGNMSTAGNSTGEAIDAVAKIPEKLGIIVTVLVAAVLIGIVVRFLVVKLG